MGDDDRKLFEQALAELSAEDVFRGKYGAPDNDTAPTGRDEQAAPHDSEEQAAADREAVRQLREDQMMVQAFTGVQRIDASKYHVPAPKQVDDDISRTPQAAEEK